MLNNCGVGIFSDEAHVRLPYPNADPDAMYEASCKASIPTIAEGRILETLEAVNAYLMENALDKYTKPAAPAAPVPGAPSAAGVTFNFLEEVSPGVVQVTPNHRYAKFWQDLDGRSYVRGCSVIIDANAKHPRIVEAKYENITQSPKDPQKNYGTYVLLVLPTDPDAIGIPFSLSITPKVDLKTWNRVIQEISERAYTHRSFLNNTLTNASIREKREILDALLADDAFMREVPIFQQPLISLVRSEHVEKQ
jgi:hypothetical protein